MDDMLMGETQAKLARILNGVAGAAYALQRVESDSQNLPLDNYEKTREAFINARNAVSALFKVVEEELAKEKMKK